MSEPASSDLLPDLPNDEPWLELKFQLQELDSDSKRILRKLEEAVLWVGEKERALMLFTSIRQLYFDVDHDAHAHAPRAVQLAQGLLTLAPEAVPPWGEMAGASRAEFDIPAEIRNCTSLPQAQGEMVRHLGGAASVVRLAHEAVLRAGASRGSCREVLEQVLREAVLFCRLLQEQACARAQQAYQWAWPYWRLAAPQEAAEHDARIAQEEADVAAELAEHRDAVDAPEE